MFNFSLKLIEKWLQYYFEEFSIAVVLFGVRKKPQRKGSGLRLGLGFRGFFQGNFFLEPFCFTLFFNRKIKKINFWDAKISPNCNYQNMKNFLCAILEPGYLPKAYWIIFQKVLIKYSLFLLCLRFSCSKVVRLIMPFCDPYIC